MAKRALIFVVLLVAAMAAVTAVVAKQWQTFLNEPMQISETGITFAIEPGTPFQSVSNALAMQGLIDKPAVLRWYARWTGEASQVQAGEYLIRHGTTPRELLTQFTKGEVKLYSFTIIEGWNVRDLLQGLQGHEQIVSTLTADQWPAFLSDLGSDYDHPEGLFLPETYRFPANTTDRDVLSQAHGLLRETLQREWRDRADDAPAATPYEALILASIIEKETARADERQEIAGVFARRLQLGMRLQTDPTVIYGIGADFNGDITRRDLRTDTPYNTYTRHGLPPTPIAMAGEAAIAAALHPADGDALYFVATGKGDGSHTFSATNEEHEAAVQQYLRRLRAQD